MKSVALAVMVATAAAGSASAAALDGIYSGAIACEAAGSSPAFTMKFGGVVRDGRFTTEHGTPGTNGWEQMNGSVADDGTLRVEGRYFADTEKPLTYSGKAAHGRMLAAGPRGPRRCTLEAAAPPPSGAKPPFRVVPDPAAVRQRGGRPGLPAFVCPTPPKPVRDVVVEPFYRKDDPTFSIVDETAYQARVKAAKPLEEMAAGIARVGDAYLQHEPRSPAIAACLASWLDSWAAERAMLGTVTQQGAFERKWTLTTLALNYALLRGASEVGAERTARIERWLADLAWATVPGYAAKPFPEQNNHLNWASLATLATAVAVQDQGLFDWGIAAARGCLGNVDSDGSLPLELMRGGKAMHYHRFALEPLVMAAEIAEANGIDLYAENGRALPRLIDYTRRIMVDPGLMAKRVGAPQSVVAADAIKPSMWAWAEPYLARFEDRELADTVTALRGKGLSYAWLGGNLTLRFHPERSW